MERERKKGLILIAVGICIPLLALPFITGFERHKGVVRNLYETGIPLRKAIGEKHEVSAEPGTEVTKDTGSLIERFTPQMLPLRYILALGVFLIFLGIMKIDRVRNRREEREG